MCYNKYVQIGVKEELKLRKIFSLSVVICFVLLSFGTVSFADPAVWDGTADISWYDASLSTYHISTAEELAGVASIFNREAELDPRLFDNKTFVLDNDIYLNAANSRTNIWMPMDEFRATFDGDGHTIYGMYIDYATILENLGYGKDRFGFVGHLVLGTIENINFDNAYIYFRGTEPYKTVGTAVGLNSGGHIQNINVTNSYINFYNCGIGGIAGKSEICTENNTTVYPVIEDCTVDDNTSVITYPNGTAGGITGANYGGESVVTNCECGADVIGNGYTGGIVGENKGFVTKCTFTGTVNKDNGEEWVSAHGGIVGRNIVDGETGAVVSDCASIGVDVYAQSWEGIGGIAGTNNGSVINCYSVNSTVGNGYPSAGGIAGNGSGTVTNCYSNNVMTSGWNNMGGIIGDGGTMTNCYYQKTSSINTTIPLNRNSTATDCDTFDENFVLATSGDDLADVLNAWVANNSGYEEWTYDSTLGYVVFGSASPITVADELQELIDTDADFTVDSEIDCDGNSEYTLKSNQDMTVEDFNLKNATVNTNGGVIIVDGNVSITGKVVFDANGKILTNENEVVTLTKGTSKGFIFAKDLNGETSVSYTFTTEGNISKPVVFNVSGLSGKTVFGITFCNIPDNRTVTVE